MSKKIALSILSALLIAVFLCTTAFAAGPADPTGKVGRRAAGELTAVSGSELTLKTLRGDTVSFQVDNSTIYRGQDGAPIQLSALLVGQKVAVAASANEANVLVARMVLVLPDDFNKGDAHLGRRVRGEVTAVIASSFTLHTLNNEDLTFQVDGATAFLGEAKSLAEVKVGMVGGVVAFNRPDKSMLALAVRLGSPVSRFAGRVTAVDPAAMTLSLHTRRGEDLTFNVDSATVFLGKDGAPINSLADIKVDMVAAVAAVKQADGAYLARKIGAADKNDLPKIRNAGMVIKVGDDSFTIMARSGKEIEFAVTADTKFAGRAKSLADLRQGMAVQVGSEKTGDEFIALVVRAGK